MRQRPRDDAPGLHHLNLGAVHGELYFRDDADHLTWTRRQIQALDRFDWTCIAFTQLSTHWHMLVDVHDQSLSRGMHWLNSEYGKDFNARHGRFGALIRRRYWSRRVRDDADALGVFAYIANNAPAAGVVERPEEWRWSSFATTIGLRDDFPFVDSTLILSQFGSSRAGAVAALRDFVERRRKTGPDPPRPM